MKVLKLPLLLLLTSILGACDDSGICLKGEGDVESRTLRVPEFEGVKVKGDTHVYIERGPKQHIEVKGQANILNELETNVSGGVWEIGFDRCLRNHETVEVYITVPQLTSAEVNGSGYISLEDKFRARDFTVGVSGSGDIKGKIEADKLESRISGSGTIELSGNAEEQTIDISGSGNHHAFDFKTNTTKVAVSGSGRAQVRASDELTVNISGSGRVFYKGNPETDVSVSGSGKLIKE
ncbi:head GIN domain-containing protein [Pontibacter sp. MBLB2868]|uniref:head GIN domain-containing protein n=1 Tax=Pontibacter sp. MBLB2868 TaxID=3451555 RepID=UPI003F754840